ncbi:MAG: hypothetical protein KC503_07815, partial [Myxococcales bacterium]|nr:hypothetical protein [Myxococcales bacterium]
APREIVCDGVCSGPLDQHVELVLVDRASEGRRFGPRDGVGLARKVGADVAAALALRGVVSTRWLHYTDADARVPPDYFALPTERALGGCSALIYPFWHDVQRGIAEGDAPSRALALYELSLRYYALGLAHAGSPYAFHTVGSTLVVDLYAYGRVHGMPRLMAGEDFHLLDKLAKVGRVLTMARDPITLLCRPSERVPFGTGAAMAAIGEGSLDCYSPQVFEVLAAFHAEIHARAADVAIPAAPPPLGDWLEAGAGPLRAAVADVIARAPDVKRALRQAFVRFDALRTLQLVHRVRDAGCGELPWREALERAPFVPSPADDTIASWRLALWQAEQKHLHGRYAGVEALGS